MRYFSLRRFSVLCFALMLAVGLVTFGLLAQVRSTQSPGGQQFPPAKTDGLNIGSSSRVEALRASLQPRTSLVPGVNRGWEGDPRTETWVSRCDKQNDANACWLAGLELAPLRKFDFSRPSTWPDAATVGLAYLERGCNFGSGEACADLGDFYRFNRVQKNQYAEFAVKYFNLKYAASRYQEACRLLSAYGCYVWAEYVDRGIGVAPDHAVARSFFGELCSAGLKVACLRSTQEQASVFPYKLYSPKDSACGNDQECWSQCTKGDWAACARVSADFMNAMVAKLPNTRDAFQKSEIFSLRTRACAEGADWGCQAFGNQSQQDLATLVSGCKAGSGDACLRACRSFSLKDRSLNCSFRYRTAGAFMNFEDPSLATRMRECFEGGLLSNGCYSFIPDYSRSDSALRLTSDENTAYLNSVEVFYRMACNSGSSCQWLADHFKSRNLDPQRGWAYLVATNVGNSTLAASLTPIEQAMATRKVIYAEPKNLAENVVVALDEGCELGNARACAVLGENFSQASYRQQATKGREEYFALIESNRKLNKEQLDAALKGCDVLRLARCYADVSKSQKDAEKDYEKAYRAGDKIVDWTTVTYDPILKERALRYYDRACLLGDSPSCKSFSDLNGSPNVSVR